jgi:hypothetical protein
MWKLFMLRNYVCINWHNFNCVVTKRKFQGTAQHVSLLNEICLAHFVYVPHFVLAPICSSHYNYSVTVDLTDSLYGSLDSGLALHEGRYLNRTIPR